MVDDVDRREVVKSQSHLARDLKPRPFRRDRETDYERTQRGVERDAIVSGRQSAIDDRIAKEEAVKSERDKKEYLKALKRGNSRFWRVVDRRIPKNASFGSVGTRGYSPSGSVRSSYSDVRSKVDRLSKAVGKLESDPIGNNWDSGMSGLGGSTFKLKEYNFGDVQKHFNGLNVDSGFRFDDPFDSKSYRRKKYHKHKYGKKKYSKKNYRRRRR